MKPSSDFVSYSNHTIDCYGLWCIAGDISEVILSVTTDIPASHSSIIINANGIQSLDSVGILLLNKLRDLLVKKNISIELQIPDAFKQLYQDVSKYQSSVESNKQATTSYTFITNLGYNILKLLNEIKLLYVFYSEICFGLFITCKNIKKFNFSEYIYTVINAGLGGIFISSLLCFLIGVTLTYQISPQFITYGANLYIVNFLGIALLREVTPLLTAIIIAGRSGSAITAQIGTMKVQEELDALKTMGISPVVKIYIPKILALVTVVPILTIIADILSVVGGLSVSGQLLGIDSSLFLNRMQEVVSINNLVVGIIKSLAFGAIIGIVACLCGTQVSDSGDSVGIHTTKSVVMSILLIIIFDAIFAILFQKLGI